MKSFSITVCFLLMFGAAAANAQSKSQPTSKDNDEFTQRLEKEIDRFLSRVTRSWTRINDSDIEESDTLDRKRRSLRTADISSDPYAHSYTGHTVIEEGETVDGDVVVKGGNLTVLGTVDGDVLVIGGTLFVKEGGTVTGNARVINGDIVKDDGGTIEGYEDKSNATASSYRTNRSSFRRYGTSFEVPWKSEYSNLDDVVLRYNRVEGIFLGLGSEKRYYWDGRRSWTGFGSFGWGFKSHTWRWNLGVARQFPLTEEGSHLLELGVEAYSLTDSKDRWIIGTNENTAAAFFIHEDFLDYFSRRGITGHVAWATQGSVLRTEVRVGYAVDRYDSLTNRVNWAMFGGDKSFRPNPPITEGNMRSVVATVGMTTLDKTVRGPEGWAIVATAELGRRMPGSDYSFDQYILDIRRYQPLGRYDNLNVRFRAGSSEGILPEQRIFQIGGLSTLQAYRYKSFVGTRMVLINAEYIVDGNFLDDLDFWPSWMFGGVNFLFLSDAGFVRTPFPTTAPQDGFDKVTWSEFNHNFGFGLANRSGSFRFAYTWRTDIKAPGALVFRFVRPF